MSSLNLLVFFLKKLLKSRNFCIFLVFLALTHFFLQYFTYRDPNDSLECFLPSTSTPSIDEADPLAKYMRIHQSILGSNDQVKKIVFSGDIREGYGNRLYTFLSSLLVAVLTDSALVVNWEGINKYIQPPISLFYVKDTRGCVGNSKKDTLELHAKDAWMSQKDIQSLMATTIPEGYSKYVYKSYDAFFMEIACNPVYFDKIRAYGLASNATINDALQTVNTKSSTEADKRRTLFKVGYEVGGNLLNKVWTPNKRLMKIIDEFVEKEFADYFVIGIQLRYWYLMDAELYTYRFINCALQIENDLLLKHNLTQKYKAIKWFIASDSETQLDKIVKLYPGKVLTANGSISHIQNPDGYQRAIIDVELLSRCNEILMTGGSTFAFVGAMKSLRLPYNIDGQQVRLNPNHNTILFKIFYSILNTISPPPIEKCHRVSLDSPPLRPDGISVF